MSETNLIPNDNFEVEAEPIPTPVMTVNSEKPDDKGNVDVEGGSVVSEEIPFPEVIPNDTPVMLQILDD